MINRHRYKETMMYSALIRLWGITVLFCVAAFGTAYATVLPIVQDLRVGVHRGMTRFVLEVDKPIELRVFTLSNPYRVVIDMPEVDWQLPARPLPQRIGLFDTLRYGLYRPGTSRIVLDAIAPIGVKRSFVMVPSKVHSFRFVLDLQKISTNTFIQSKNATELLIKSPVSSAVRIPAAQPKYQTTTNSLARIPPPGRKPNTGTMHRVVILDPGHGGIDPGAIGLSGIYEKHITLSIAREVRKLLQKTGRYKVFLTRDRDRFVRLRDRVAFARHNHGQLFLSLHADSIRKKNVRGLSVYTLSEKASDTEAAQLAEKENKADLIAGIDLTGETEEVTNILIDLAQRETMNQSARAADFLIKALAHETKLLRNSYRFAGFTVLKAPDIPSVLIELGFLSNRKDEQALRRTSYRAKLARAIVVGINRYFTTTEKASRH